jgi:porin
MRRRGVAARVIVLLGASLCAHAGADDAASGRPYSGDLLARSTLTGDWGGARNDLAARGITFDASLTQVAQGVGSGGKDDDWKYGGRSNLTGRLDTQKLGLWPGGFLTLELEGNWSDSVNGHTGALMAANTNQLFPEPTGDNFNVPQLSFAQFLSPYAGVLVGKLDTTSGDANAFAHGKGDGRFLNLGFSINPVALLVMPYSPLGAGVIVLPTKDPDAAIVNFMITQSEARASTPGFDDIEGDKLTFAGEGRVRTGFFGRTGHQLVGAAYSNKEFTSLDQRLSFVLENRALEEHDGSWCVYYNFDQFLYEMERESDRGIGLFGRFGAADGEANPLQYFFSAGIGGTGVLPGRPRDRFGIGYYYLDVENPTLQGPFRTRSFLGDEWGFEAFYNVAITPWMLLTPDLQVIGPSQERRLTGFPGQRRLREVDTATVLGLRLQLIF